MAATLKDVRGLLKSEKLKQSRKRTFSSPGAGFADHGYLTGHADTSERLAAGLALKRLLRGERPVGRKKI